MRKVNYKPKTCKWCGTKFTPTYPRNFYCTPECSKAAKREYARERARKYYEANKERINERCRRENAGRIKERKRKYYEANKERIKEYQRTWRANNPDKVGAAEARRAQAELEGNATPELIEAKWEASDKTCCLCGNPIDPDLPPPHRMSRTLEHLTPIIRGGRHDIENLDFAHFSCNASKKDKTLEEYKAWLASQGERS